MGGSAARAGTAQVKSPMEIAAEANQVVDIQNQGQLGQQQKYGTGFEQAYINTLQQSNPQVWNIQQALGQNILGRVQNPSAISPQLMSQFDENIRAAQAQRGMGLGGQDAFQAALGRSGFQEQTAMQNLGLAQNYLNQYRTPGSFLTNLAGTPQGLPGATGVVQTQDQARMQNEIAASQRPAQAGWGQMLASAAGTAAGAYFGTGGTLAGLSSMFKSPPKPTVGGFNGPGEDMGPFGPMSSGESKLFGGQGYSGSYAKEAK